jgi:hypothetical protein
MVMGMVVLLGLLLVLGMQLGDAEVAIEEETTSTYSDKRQRMNQKIQLLKIKCETESTTLSMQYLQYCVDNHFGGDSVQRMLWSKTSAVELARKVEEGRVRAQQRLGAATSIAVNPTTQPTIQPSSNISPSKHLVDLDRHSSTHWTVEMGGRLTISPTSSDGWAERLAAETPRLKRQNKGRVAFEDFVAVLCGFHGHEQNHFFPSEQTWLQVGTWQQEKTATTAYHHK